MTEVEKIEEIARIRARLSEAVRNAEPAEWRQIVRKTIHQLDDVIERLETAGGETRTRKRKASTRR